ncbi:hypothetical protein ElyMa_001151400 [Elysia marginata]|uniref:Uncharacterized protein n=1 Tax=Elysia marginata TaxID=1093978 RepID=A0AAV4I0C8_9GAST|nr:hypothetical protein ElyMa_001151400 [Elysia marginata]
MTAEFIGAAIGDLARRRRKRSSEIIYPWHVPLVVIQSKNLTARLEQAVTERQMLPSRGQVPALWPSGKDTRSEIGWYEFDPGPSQTKDFKIGISS